jgi:hypothetical protein
MLLAWWRYAVHVQPRPFPMHQSEIKMRHKLTTDYLGNKWKNDWSKCADQRLHSFQFSLDQFSCVVLTSDPHHVSCCASLDIAISQSLKSNSHQTQNASNGNISVPASTAR